MSTPINTIFSWFETGDFPTQQQFQATFSSFFHKDEDIPAEKIQGLSQMFQGVATSESVTNHIQDPDAHAEHLTRRDASNLTSANVTEWRTKLGVNYIATVDTAPGTDDGNVYNKEQIALFLNTINNRIDDRVDFTTQEILSGGNYNDLEVTADLLVFKNENAQAVINGIRGRKEFHILNLSSTYEVKINHNSSSVSGDGEPIMLPTTEGSMGIKGTARMLHTDGYGYFVADTWGSRYRPEFKGLTEDEVVVVDENSKSKTKKIIELRVFRDAQSTAMTKGELNAEYPNAVRGFEVICRQIGKTYMKIDNSSHDWVSINITAI